MNRTLSFSRLAKGGLVALLALMVAAPNALARTSKHPDTLVVATTYDAKTLDPYMTNDVASSNAMRQIYETLVAIDAEGNVVPSLAEKIDRVDGKTYRFTLKKGVTFHNGETLTADDALYSLKRAYERGASVRHILGVIDPAGFKKIDDLTFEVKTKEAMSSFLAALTHFGGGVILNQKAVEAAGDDYGFKPVGTGPYKLASWKKGDRMELERFEAYHGTKPEFPKMVLRVIPEASNRTIELESGDVDISFEVSSLDVSRVKANKNLELLTLVDTATTYMGFNCSKAPYDNEKLRQALTLAINIPGSVKAVFRGNAFPAYGPIAPNVKYSNNDLQPSKTDIKKAKKLLAEAGYPNGLTTTLWTNSKKVRVDMATIIQAQLKKIGVTVKIQVLEWGAYLQGLKDNKHELFIVGWTCQTPDPDMAVFPTFHSSQIGGNNFAAFGDAEVDALLDKARITPDGAERKALYFDIQDKLREKAPWVFLANKKIAYGMQNYLEGFTPSPYGFHALYEVKMKK
ncbi:ABC transporter substrate-binding protein [Desulfoluna butyratoxydans]|uniref:Solute-binding protein family 5 domain n=1 Tax=Desulfoluna butyratoxydans TaxID=231438 RepID=A0A4U8YQB3_9BACT|nr:ABC transporter substrate-binding protein [Desulfoluna butyratoxydans]VFQ43922.1 solute-binding protein family 5 domain [Desulfoluna butyratoxydans]